MRVISFFGIVLLRVDAVHRARFGQSLVNLSKIEDNFDP